MKQWKTGESFAHGNDRAVLVPLLSMTANESMYEVWVSPCVSSVIMTAKYDQIKLRVQTFFTGHTRVIVVHSIPI